MSTFSLFKTEKYEGIHSHSMDGKTGDDFITSLISDILTGSINQSQAEIVAMYVANLERRVKDLEEKLHEKI